MAQHFPECNWTPNQIARVIKPVRSSTQVVHIETDQGEAYLKGMDNPQGNESLACELVGSRLAKLTGLFVPDFAIIENDILEITREDGGTVGFGPAFVSRAVPGSPGGSEAFLDRLLNPEDVPMLVGFDTWTANLDRCPPVGYLDETPNWDNIFFVPVGNQFQMTVFDHTHCFSETGLEHALEDRSYENDKRVYGVFPEFKRHCSEDALRNVSRAIREIDVEDIQGDEPGEK